jgi:hypothetical protein
MGLGRDVVTALAKEPQRAGLVMDFDGVLSPIVADPATLDEPAAARAPGSGFGKPVSAELTAEDQAGAESP